MIEPSKKENTYKWKCYAQNVLSARICQMSNVHLMGYIEKNAIADKKTIILFLYIGYYVPQLSLLFKLNSLFGSALFSLRIHSGREKIIIKFFFEIKPFFKKVIYLFCFQRHLKHFVENWQFCQKKKLEMTHIVRGSRYLHHYDAFPTKVMFWLTPNVTFNVS